MSQGVVVPEGQRRGTDKGTPGRVYAAVPANLIAVQYADGDGRIVKAFVYEVGGVYYMPKSSEEFAQGLKELKPAYAQQVAAMLATHAVGGGIPEEDAVTVVAPHREVDVV